MQIVAFDADELADGSGKAAITWISKQLLRTKHRMNPGVIDFIQNPEDYNRNYYGEGWAYSEMRTWLKGTIKPLIPSEVRNSIKTVIKYTVYSRSEINQKTADDVWIPSHREILEQGWPFEGYYETEGPTYKVLFASTDDRIKCISGTSNAVWWWLRTNSGSQVIDSRGNYEPISGSGEGGVALGFCL